MSLCDAGGCARAWTCAHSSMAPQPERAGKQARAGGAGNLGFQVPGVWWGRGEQALGGCHRAGAGSPGRAAASTALHTAEAGHKAGVGHRFGVSPPGLL